VEILEHLETEDLPTMPADGAVDAADVVDRSPQAVARNGHWVLLVERDVQSLVSVTAQLEALGVRVQTAADGEEALETLQEERDCSLLLLAAPASQERSCDTILRVRQEIGPRKPAIVILGDLDEAQRLRCLEAGADGFLSKPVGTEALAAALDRALGGGTSRSAVGRDEQRIEAVESEEV
jgi:CheY-like chemotaxis protein